MTQMDPNYRPSLMEKDISGGSHVLPFAGSDLVLSPSQWSSHVVGMNCSIPHSFLITLPYGLSNIFFHLLSQFPLVWCFCLT